MTTTDPFTQATAAPSRGQKWPSEKRLCLTRCSKTVPGVLNTISPAKPLPLEGCSGFPDKSATAPAGRSNATVELNAMSA